MTLLSTRHLAYIALIILLVYHLPLTVTPLSWGAYDPILDTANANKKAAEQARQARAKQEAVVDLTKPRLARLSHSLECDSLDL